MVAGRQVKLENGPLSVAVLWLKNIACFSSLVVDGDYQNDDGGSNTRTIMIMIKRKLIMMTMKTVTYTP